MKKIIIILIILLFSIFDFRINAEKSDSNQDQEWHIIERGLTWNKYQFGNTNRYKIDTFTSYMNYVDESGKFVPINKSIYELENSHPARNFGYTYGNDKGVYHAYFKEYSEDLPIAFVYKQSRNPSQDVFATELFFVGYFDPETDFQGYHILSYANRVPLRTFGNKISYENIFYDTNLNVEYYNKMFKEDIVFGERFQRYLKLNPPTRFGLSEDSYLMIGFVCYFPGLHVCRHNNEHMGENFILHPGKDTFLRFNDMNEKTRFILPIGEAFEKNNISNSTMLTYYAYKQGSNRYFLSGIPYSIFVDNLTAPVIFDPSSTVYSDADDGFIYTESQPTYADAHDNATGTVNIGYQHYRIGQDSPLLPVGYPKEYAINRGYLFFNTTDLNDTAVITNVSLYQKRWADYSTLDFYVVAQGSNDNNISPHKPLIEQDYYYGNYSGEFGKIWTGSMGADTYIYFNQSGLDYINKTGWTKIIIRSHRDIDSIPPISGITEQIYFYSADSSYPPKLTIEYFIPTGTKILSTYPPKGADNVDIPFVCNVTIENEQNRTVDVRWYWLSPSSGWSLFGENLSVELTANISVTLWQSNTNFSDYEKEYQWMINVTDQYTSNTTGAINFTTEEIKTYINPFPSYNISKNPLSITATGDSILDNVTLYYRYTTDNISWNWSGYYIHRGITKLPSGTTEKIIKIDHKVNLSHAFVLGYPYMQQVNTPPISYGAPAGIAYNLKVRVHLIDSSHIEIQRETASNKEISVHWQVIECFNNEFYVQRGVLVHTGSSTTETISIPNTVNASRTMVWHSNSIAYTNDLNINDARNWEWISNISSDGTQITFTRTGTLNVQQTFRWVAVEWNLTKIKSFQMGDTLVDSNYYTSPKIVSINKVNLNHSLLLYQVSAKDDNGLESSTCAGYIKNETALAFYEYDTTVGSSNVHWYVIEFDNVSKYQYETRSGSATWSGGIYTLNESVNVSQSISFVMISCNGDGTAQPRAFTVWNLSSPTELTIWRNYTGQKINLVWQVAELHYFSDWIEFEVDEEYPWSWSFNFPNGTGYYQFYTIGKKENSTTEIPPYASFDESCQHVLKKYISHFYSRRNVNILAFFSILHLCYLLYYKRRRNKKNVR